MSLSSAKATLDRAQLRATRCRLAVLQVFHASPRERLTVDDIAERLMLQGDWISVPSIYKTVRGLFAQNVLDKDWHDGGRNVFWLRAPDMPLHEIVCRHCQRGVQADDEELSLAVARLCDAHGLGLGEPALRIHISCAACSGRIGPH